MRYEGVDCSLYQLLDATQPYCSKVPKDGRGMRFFAHFHLPRLPQEVGSSTQTSRMAPGIHRSISPSSRFQPSETILVPNTTDSRGNLTPLPALHFPPKWTELDESQVGDTPAELDDEETEVSACMQTGLG